MRKFLLSLLLVVLATSIVVWPQRRSGGGSTGTGRNTNTNPTPNSSSGFDAPPAPPPVSSSPNHAGDEGQVEFRSDTILVQVPTIVTDKSGQHVQGLKRDDFEIFENGQEQKIGTFEEIVTSRAPFTLPANKNGEFSNVDPAAETAHSAVMIALDTVNTPFLDQTYGRKELVKYLAQHMDASQPVGLVQISSRGLKVIHGLTSDPKALLDALKAVNGEIPALQGTGIDAQAAALAANGPAGTFLPGSTSGQIADFVTNGDPAIVQLQQSRAIEVTMRAFLDIATSLSGIPGRKALIWATGSFPFAMDSYSAVPGGYLSTLYEHAVKALADAEVSVYPVDVRGLVSTSPAGDATYKGGLSGQAFARAATARSWLQSSTIDTLRDFADMTGGRAFYNSNDVAGGFRRAADDSSQYYILGYYLNTKNTKAGWRQLKVRSRKSGTEVRARAGFFVTNATTNPQASRQLDIEAAIASPFESTGLPVTVKWLGMSAHEDKKTVDFSIRLPAGAMFIDEPHNNHYDMELDAVAFKDEQVAGTLGKVMEGAIQQAALGGVKSTGVHFHYSMDLPAGQYTVRFVVRDNLTGRLGSVSAPLTVN